MTLPRIGITLGDPGGIGPEIVLKALAPENSLPKAQYIIFGSGFVLEAEMKRQERKLVIPSFEESRFPSLPGLFLWDIPLPDEGITIGIPSKPNGQASFLCFEQTVEQAKKGVIQALVTAPISKMSWEMAGIEWLGHTDYLSHLYPQAIMSFWSDKLKVALYTHHLSLKESIQRIKMDALHDFFTRLDRAAKKIQPDGFQLLVAGLNPHAGEGGLLGSEENSEIIPAIDQARKKGVKISGPFPPDTVFLQALDHPDRWVIALYHDQGLIPFKLESFEEGVNLTLSLPFIRTSPDHGTAFDIAGQNRANPQSLIKAIELASSLSPLF